jgi:hypothetical protein
MEPTLVNRRRKYEGVRLIEPPKNGYLHLAAAVEPARGRTPVPGRSPRRAALLRRLTSLAAELEQLDEVERVTLYQAVVMPPISGYARKSAHQARFDVAVLIETTSPETVATAQSSGPGKEMIDALHEASEDVLVMPATCHKCIADVDKSKDGIFLFNYFVADEPEVALELWDYLAGWYVLETGLDNSTLLTPMGESDYAFVNHAHLGPSLSRFIMKQFMKPGFRSQILANQEVNRTGAMPIVYSRA